MADGKLISVKRVKINKANQTIVAVVAVSSFILVFSLVAAKALASQYSYQNRVASAQQQSVNQLQQDSQAANSLITSYNTFVNQPTNIIGGNEFGSGNQDGSNSKIILDSLPNTYDFPALVTSVQNLISVQGVSIQSITGTDTGGSGLAPTSTTTPTTTTTLAPTPGNQTTPIAIPFTFTVQGPYSAMETVISNLQNSIRPIQIQSIDMSGSDNTMTMVVDAQTYYLPSSGLSLTQETIK